MDVHNTITLSPKYKYLSFDHYDYIILEIIKRDSFPHARRTELIQSLASSVGTSVSNIYTIIRDASITVTNSSLVTNRYITKYNGNKQTHLSISVGYDNIK